MSAFKQALQSTVTPRSGSGRPCSVNEALKAMPEDDRADLESALDRSSGVTNAQIHDALQSLGYPVGRQTVGMHRRKGCRCFSGVSVSEAA